MLPAAGSTLLLPNFLGQHLPVIVDRQNALTRRQQVRGTVLQILGQRRAVQGIAHMKLSKIGRKIAAQLIKGQRRPGQAPNNARPGIASIRLRV